MDEKIKYLIDRIRRELECARVNTEFCEEHYEDEEMGSLEHSDIHVDAALDFLAELEKELN